MRQEKDENKKIRIYFAGPLFSTLERSFNKLLSNKLEEKGYEVFLPQEAGIIYKEGKFDYKAIAERDKQEVKRCDVLLANLDGSDTDSGTALEAGMAIGLNKPVITWRTDIRTLEEGLHWNAMFELCDKIIYCPSLFGEEKKGIEMLIENIDKAIKEIIGR